MDWLDLDIIVINAFYMLGAILSLLALTYSSVYIDPSITVTLPVYELGIIFFGFGALYFLSKAPRAMRNILWAMKRKKNERPL
jgi:hypothetical protein